MGGTGEHDEDRIEGTPVLLQGEQPRVEHAWDDPIWGTGIPPAGLEERGGQELGVELIGERLRVFGVADLGRFRRLTDYVNMLQGFFMLRHVTLLSRTGTSSRLTMPELRLRLDDVAIVAQRRVEAAPAHDPSALVEKVPQRLVLMTPGHIVAGDVHVHAGGSILHFVDSTDPRFIPMSDVRVRWLDDRTLVGHFPFALVHRSKILGVATEGLGDAQEAAARLAESQAEAAPEEVAAGEDELA
jgi:hypothetical protein